MPKAADWNELVPDDELDSLWFAATYAPLTLSYCLHSQVYSAKAFRRRSRDPGTRHRLVYRRPRPFHRRHVHSVFPSNVSPIVCL